MKLDTDFAGPMHMPVHFTEAIKSTPAFTRQAVVTVLGLTGAAAMGLAFVFFFFAVAAASTIPFRVAAIGAGLGSFMGLMVSLNIFERMAIQTERISNTPPEARELAPVDPQTSWVLITGPNTRIMGQFNVPPTLLTDWCQAAYNSQSLAYAAWVPRFCQEFGGRGRDKFEEFRAEWIRRELAEDAKGNVGLRLTDPLGWAFVEQALVRQGLLRVETPPTPPQARLGTGELENGPNRHTHTGTQG